MPDNKPASRSSRTRRTATPARATSSRSTAAGRSKGASSRSTAAKSAAPKRAAAGSTRGAASTGGAASTRGAASKRAVAAKRPSGGATAAKGASKPKPRAAAKRGTAAKPASGGATRRTATARRSGPAAAASGRGAARPATPRPRAGGARGGNDDLSSALRGVWDVFTRGVVLTVERLQETLDDAVVRGRLTSGDAEELVSHLVSTGRRQAEEVRAEIERVLRGSDVELTIGGLRTHLPAGSDRVLREVDRVRRTLGVGPTFPVLGYDELTVAQILTRLDDLTPAQIRKVRDHERRHDARKTVLDAIERKLG